MVLLGLLSSRCSFGERYGGDGGRRRYDRFTLRYRGGEKEMMVSGGVASCVSSDVVSDREAA